MTDQAFVLLVHLLVDVLVPPDGSGMHLGHTGLQLRNAGLQFLEFRLDSFESVQLSLQTITLKTESVSPNNNDWTGHLRTLVLSFTNIIHNRELVAAVYLIARVDESQGLS